MDAKQPSPVLHRRQLHTQASNGTLGTIIICSIHPAGSSLRSSGDMLSSKRPTGSTSHLATDDTCVQHNVGFWFMMLTVPVKSNPHVAPKLVMPRMAFICTFVSIVTFNQLPLVTQQQPKHTWKGELVVAWFLSMCCTGEPVCASVPPANDNISNVTKWCACGSGECSGVGQGEVSIIMPADLIVCAL